MFRNILFSASYLFFTVSSWPTNCNGSSPNDTAHAAQSSPVKRDVGGYRNVGYFVNWGIYGRNFQPQNISASKLSHILYAFANVRPETGEVYLSDTYADLEKHYPTDSWSEPGTNLYGTLKQLYILKKANRHLKTLLSIGGWTYSPSFAPAASTAAGRAKFAQSSVQLVQDLGFDGLDIDWEYPGNSAEAKDFVALLAAVRAALDAARGAAGYHFLLSVAAPAGPAKYGVLDLVGMDKYLDFWNLMTYDYTGSFSPLTGHSSNLFPSRYSPLSTPFSASRPIADYLAAGIPAAKLTLGMPLYGRAFTNTSGLGKPYAGIGGGSWEPGIWDYKALPLENALEIYDPIVGAGYSYDPRQGMLVSYDIVATVARKMRWARERGLGGAMWWELSGDRVGEGSLVDAVGEVWGAGYGYGYGGVGLERTENLLGYVGSKYANLRAGMPGE